MVDGGKSGGARTLMKSHTKDVPLMTISRKLFVACYSLINATMMKQPDFGLNCFVTGFNN